MKPLESPNRRCIPPSFVSLLIAFFLMTSAGATNASSSFFGLGTSWFTSEGKSLITADGSLIGVSVTSEIKEGGRHETLRVFRWSERDGASSLDILKNSDSYVYYHGKGVSADGSVIVGYKNFPYLQSAALRWTAVDGIRDIGKLGGSGSKAVAVSANGAVIVGTSTYQSSSGNEHAFRWSNDEGMTDIGTLGGPYSHPYAISADGSVIVGDSSTSSGPRYAFRWVRGRSDGIAGNPQMASIGTLGGSFSYATAVSADGAVVVGGSYTKNNNYEHAFLWTEKNGMEDLGTFFGGCRSIATRVSGDGLVVVGESTPIWSDLEPFRWTRSSGMQTVEKWLTSAGVAVPDGWKLKRITSINHDGSILVGVGINSKGVEEAWYARVDPSSAH